MDIKFRAWVKPVCDENGDYAYGGYMIEPQDIKSLFLSVTDFLMSGRRGVGLEYFEQGSLLPGYGTVEFMRSDEFELMQCSGLKDRRGVDIFEKDLVRLNDASGREWIAVVEFVDGCFETKFLQFQPPIPIPDEWKHRDYLKVYVANHAVEVIGSVYLHQDEYRG